LEVVQKLVSVDFNHNPASSSFALDQTKVMDGTFVSVMTWYDNEWGFSNRMADTAVAGQADLMAFRTLDDLDVKGKRVLVRADLNVPVADGKVTDDTRIVRQAPTLRELSERGARVIVLSHFDRPKGKVVPSMSLKVLQAPLSDAVGRKVAFAEDCIGPKAEAAVSALKDGDLLLEEHPLSRAGRTMTRRGRAVGGAGRYLVNTRLQRRPSCPCRPTAWRGSCRRGSMQTELTHLQKLGNRAPLLAVVGGARSHQDRAAGKSGDAGRDPGDRRRHGNLPGGARHQCRQIALRSRSSGDRAQSDSHGQ
jgi:hypothetical protein